MTEPVKSYKTRTISYYNHEGLRELVQEFLDKVQLEEYFVEDSVTIQITAVQGSSKMVTYNAFIMYQMYGVEI